MIFRKYVTCRICEMIGGWFQTRSTKLANGSIKMYPDNLCIPCANEISRNRYYKTRSTPELSEAYKKKKAIWKSNNLEKVRLAAKKYWLKNREEISKRRMLRKCLKEQKKRKKNSHHRIPTNKESYSRFDFRRTIKTMQQI